MPDDKAEAATAASPVLANGLPNETREVKVRLPVEQVLHLHYARLAQGKNFSQIVSSALTRYFDEFVKR